MVMNNSNSIELNSAIKRSVNVFTAKKKPRQGNEI